ncbi:MAG: PAS domain S-box protein [Symploca sp. SIO2G7]|nr:PAS domain S-box protein [Symploca sp. SIO2G7]
MQPSSSSDPPISSEQLIERFGVITRKIRQFLDLDYILNTAVTEMRELLQIDRLLIYRFNPDWSGYVMIESVASGWMPLLSQVIDDPCFRTKWAQRYQQGRVRAISDVNDSDIRPCHLGLLTKLQVRANLVVPILPGNSLWGLLIAHQCSSPKQWSKSEVDLLKHLTLQIKSAIRQVEATRQSQTVLLESQRAEAERQKLNQELEARVEERTAQLRQANKQLQAEIAKRLQVQQGLQESQICLQLINAISTAKTTGFSKEQIIEQTLNKIHHFFANLGVSYSTIEGKSKLRIIQASEPPGMQLPKDLATDLKAVPDYLNLLRQGELMITEDATQEPMLAPLAGWMHSCNTQALLAVPLRQSDKFVGLLSLHASTPRSWSEYQVGTMMEIAEYLANSLQETHEQQKRRQAEQALRESERKFHAIFNQTFQFIGLMSPEGILLEANQKALELAGLQAEEVIHRPLWEAGWWKISPATQAGLQKAIAQAAAGRFVRYEVNHLSPEDAVAIIDFSIKPVRDETGKVVLLISEGRDITEHKQALEELQQFNKQLENKVRERTTDLIEANQQLLAEVEERRRAEQSLHQTQDLFRQLAEHFQQVFWLARADLQEFLYISPACEKVLGKTAPSLNKPLQSGRDILRNSIHPEDQERVQASLSQLHQGEYSQEYRIIKPNGEVRRIYFHALGIPNEQGEIYRFAGICQDITERQLEPIPQPSLTIPTKELTNMFDTILRASVDHIYLMDREGKYLYANPERLKAWELELGDVIGKTWQELGFAAEERENFELQWQEVLKTGKPISGEIQLTRVDGIRHHHYLINPVLNQGNQVEQVVIISRDITEQKQVETALQASEQRFRTAIDNMLDSFGIYSAIRDESGQIVDFSIEYINAAAENSSLLNKQEHIGQSLCQLFPFHRETELFAQYCQVVETAQPLIKESFIYPNTNNLGQEKAFDLHAVKLGDGLVVCWRDISNRKQAEDQLRESLQEKETLLKEMHHRTKNSLQIICDLLHLYSRSLGEPQVLKLFEDSQNRVKAIWQIHEQLYQEDNSAQIDFPEHVTTLVNNICHSYGAENRAITCNVNAEPVLLTAKTALPCSLIINELVCNSLKSAFPAQRGGEIGVSIQNNQSQNQLILTVSDNGIGIPEDFDWYNPNYLGLQLVRSLTKQLEGRIELDLTQGTEFQIILSTSCNI